VKLDAAKTDPVYSDVTKGSSVASGPRRVEVNIDSPQLRQFHSYAVLEKNYKVEIIGFFF
jgi:hypothetical protein